MGFPFPAYTARCPMVAQPPRQITLMQTGSICTSKSIAIGLLSNVILELYRSETLLTDVFLYANSHLTFATHMVFVS